ncbi:MAG: tetratricopeptide repeat protein [Myxococcales bacterium]|nr:tetratricopeptide repeat protein [Myxococcales bacterium]
MKDDRYWHCLDQAMEASHGGHTDEAMAWLDEALKENPNGAEAHNGRGEILWDEARIDEALYEFELATLADPKFATAHLNRAELLIEELGEYEEALQLCDRLLGGAAELPRLDRTLEAEIHYLKSKACFYQEDLEGALFLVRRALQCGGDLAISLAFEGQILLELGRFEESRRSLETAVALDPESGHAFYHLALVLERLGEAATAERHFESANALEPDHYPLPAAVEDTFFRGAVAEALDNLPRSIREYVEDVPVLVEDYPSDELIALEGVSPQILGLYIGTPRTEAGPTHQPLDVTRVILFKKNLEKICRDREELIDQIQITVRHEIGHHLGLSEEDMERLGLA